MVSTCEFESAYVASFSQTKEWFVLEDLDRITLLLSPGPLCMGKLSLSCAWLWPCWLPVALISSVSFLSFNFYFETGLTG